MKKILSLILVLVLTMGLATGCNSNDTGNETAGGSNSSQNQTGSADNNNVTDNATENTNTTEAATKAADTEGEETLSYASSKLRLHDDTEDCGFEGMIDAYIDIFDDSVVVGDTVYYCSGTENKRTVVPENAEKFYYAYGKNVVVGNSDGTYALCQDDTIYPFIIEEGELVEAYRHTELNKETVILSVVRSDNKLYMNIHDMDTMEILDTIDVVVKIGDSDDEHMGEIKQLERYLEDVYYILDTNGKLYSGIGDTVVSIKEYENSEIGDEYGECILLTKIKAENVDELYCFNSFYETPVYSQIGDDTHLYVKEPGEKIADAPVELTMELPNGYMVANIVLVKIVHDEMLVEFDDKAIYCLDIDTQEWEKKDELSDLNNEGKVLQISTCSNDFVVLLDDHTLYEVK